MRHDKVDIKRNVASSNLAYVLMSLIIRLFEGSRTNYKVIEKRLARAVYVGRRTNGIRGNLSFSRAISRHVGGDSRKRPDKISSV